MSQAPIESETNPEALVALLVVFLLVVVFVQQSGLLGGPERDTEMASPNVAEVQKQAQQS